MRLVHKLLTAGLIWLAGVGIATAQPVEMSVGQAKAIAQQQLATNPTVTQEIALALLEGLPNDLDALLLLAAARIALQQYDAAAVAAKHAYSVAPKGVIRMNAARLASSAHFRAQQHSRAEWWLRKALHNAPDTQSEAALQRDFQIVRRANPLTANLGFSMAPNSNINNGSASEFVYIWNLPFQLSPDAQALAGYEVSANVDLKYRLSESQNHSTVAGLTLFGRTFELSEGAKSDISDAAAAAAAQAEAAALASGATAAEAAAAGQLAAENATVTGADYAFSVAEISLKHTHLFKNFTGPSSLAVHYGKNWYGGEPYTVYARLTLTQDFGLSDRTGLQLGLSGNHQISIRDGGVPSDTLSLDSTLTHVLGNGDRIGFSLGLQETQSPDANLENTAVNTKISYQLARPVLGMSLSGNISARKADYPTSSYDPNGRLDETFGLGLTAVFVDLSFFGFSPSVTLEASKTMSNVGLYDRESAGLRFGIQSTF